MNASPAPPRPASPHRAESILVVEDEILVRTLVCEELRAAQYQVIEAADADEAVAILTSGARIDLILSDVRMPGTLDGLGLLAFVRQDRPTLPVIITSGHLQPDTAFPDAWTTFLAKPYFFGQALELVAGELARAK